MRKFLHLLERELKSYFYSPVAYIVLFCFLLATGWTFYLAVSLINRGPAEFTVVEAYFNIVLFWIVFLLVFPLITMRTFAEEFKLGTVESLMTAPVNDLQVVLSKYVAALIFFLILIAPSLLYFAVFDWVSGAEAARAAGAYLGSYLLIILVGAWYLAIGCCASALTSNQIVAGVVSFCLILLFFFAGLLGFFTLNISPAMRDVFGYFSLVEHMSEFSKGMIDSRPLVFYPSMTFLFLYLTWQIFQTRRWRA